MVLMVAAACGHAATARVRATCGSGWAALTATRAPVRSVAPIGAAPDAVIAGVRIEGVPAALATTLESQVQTRAGQRFGDAPVKDDLRRLWRLGVIDGARVEAHGHDVVFVLTERPRVGAVVLRSDDPTILRRFALLPGAAFEPARLERMATALQVGLVRAGHLDADVAVSRVQRRAAVDVCVAATPGPRVTISSLRFPGHHVVPEELLARTIHGADDHGKGGVNHVGGIYDPDALDEDELYVESLYWDRGYATVKVGPVRIARHGPTLAIELPIVEGPRFSLRTVRVPWTPGVTLAVRAGDPFSRRLIAEARDRLEHRLGVPVIPLTKLDLVHAQIDLTFEARWRWPWDAFAYWASHSRSR